MTISNCNYAEDFGSAMFLVFKHRKYGNQLFLCCWMRYSFESIEVTLLHLEDIFNSLRWISVMGKGRIDNLFTIVASQDRLFIEREVGILILFETIYFNGNLGSKYSFMYLFRLCIERYTSRSVHSLGHSAPEHEDLFPFLRRIQLAICLFKKIFALLWLTLLLYHISSF